MIKRKGVTLVETLISILLVSALLVGVLGAYFISMLSTAHARHRMTAMNILHEHIEQEIRAGYDGGNDGDADYYVTTVSGDPVSVTIDDRGTTDTSDDLNGTITPSPYFPNNIENADGSPINRSGVPYKIIGFVVQWTEDYTSTTCTERAASYVAYHATT